jgi:hypothetical protein
MCLNAVELGGRREGKSSICRINTSREPGQCMHVKPSYTEHTPHICGKRLQGLISIEEEGWV